MNLVKPVFIVGHPRSGTTLLQCMLSAHSAFYSLPETHFFSEAMRRLGKPPDEILYPDDLNKLLALLDEFILIDHPRFFENLRNYLKITGKEFFEAIVAQYFYADSMLTSQRVIEKTPMHVSFIDQILALFPDANIIHIVRDPRDVVSSVMQLPFVTSRWIPFYASSWNNVLEAAEVAQLKHPDLVYTLRYDDLAENPKHEIEKICNFLGVEFEIQMITEFSKEYEHSVNSKVETWKSGVNVGKIVVQNEIWRNRISLAEAWLIEVLCKNWMARNHYFRKSSSTTIEKISIIVQQIRIGIYENQKQSRWLSSILNSWDNQ